MVVREVPFIVVYCSFTVTLLLTTTSLLTFPGRRDLVRNEPNLCQDA